MRNRALFAAILLLACVMPRIAAAQWVYDDLKPFIATFEAYGNATGAYSVGEESVGGDRADPGGRIDAGLRLYARVTPEKDWSLGVRLVGNFNTDDYPEWGDRSLIGQTPWGRVELGWRPGLPDTILGYAPNSYTFTSAEFGPASGPSLDPDGGLPTSFLGRPLADQINALSYLGLSSGFASDDSPKVIYVSPRLDGWQFGASYAPDIDPETDRGRFEDSVLTGLVYEHYYDQDLIRIGGSYTYAQGETRRGRTTSDLQSGNIGVTWVIDEELTLGVSATFDGDTGLTAIGGDYFSSNGWGVTASANQNIGPWTLGGYVQYAENEGDTSQAGNDELMILELGASYRIDTKIRLYGASYLYDLNDESGAGSIGQTTGAVFLLGTRLTL